MKKVFVVSLLLMSIFLIVNAEMVLAQECTTYLCNGKHLCLDGESGGWEDCVEICIDEGYAEIEGYCWGCDLGGRSLFSSNKNFVGIGGSCGPDLRCSVELRGRAMTVDFYEVGSNPPCMDQLRCVKNNECELD